MKCVVCWWWIFVSVDVALIACKATMLEHVQLALSQKPTEHTEHTEPIETNLVQKQVGFRDHTACLCKSLCLHSLHEIPASRTLGSDREGVLLSVFTVLSKCCTGWSKRVESHFSWLWSNCSIQFWETLEDLGTLNHFRCLQLASTTALW